MLIVIQWLMRNGGRCASLATGPEPPGLLHDGLLAGGAEFPGAVNHLRRHRSREQLAELGVEASGIERTAPTGRHPAFPARSAAARRVSSSRVNDW